MARAAALAAALAASATAQMGMEGMGMGSGRRMRDKEPLAVKADLPCIGCDVCEIVAAEVYREAEKQRAAAPMTTKKAKPGQKKEMVSSFSEADVTTILEAVCNRRKEAGEWLWYIDLVESKNEAVGYGGAHRALSKKEKSSGKNFLRVFRAQRGGDIRKWDRESATVKRSCDELFDTDVEDVEDLVVPLWRGGLAEKEFKSLVCKDLTRRCKGDRKPVPPKGREDFEYEASDKTLLDTERMMENMKDQGMPMVMQSREDMMEELYEQMEAEGLSREEADAFMESVKSDPPAGDEAAAEEVAEGEAGADDAGEL